MFYFDNFYGKRILKSTLLENYNCFFTTRDFVLTSASREDLKEIAEKNRYFLEEKTNSQITTAVQTHSCNVEIIDKNKQIYDNTDGLISNIENSLLLMNFADCVPIILYNKKENIGGIVHAGWRGTAQKIVEKAIKEFNTNPTDITALIGPSIGKCCFETHEDVFNKLMENKLETELYTKKDDKYFIDLKKINYNQLKKMGVEEIDICSYCTCCMSDIFFSYRKELGLTARHSAIVQIKRG